MKIIMSDKQYHKYSKYLYHNRIPLKEQNYRKFSQDMTLMGHCKILYAKIHNTRPKTSDKHKYFFQTTNRASKMTEPSDKIGVTDTTKPLPQLKENTSIVNVNGTVDKVSIIITITKKLTFMQPNPGYS